MYSREYDFYREAARRCAEQCEVAAEQNGIRVIVTHRAKRPDRLREKLERRNATNPYSTPESIREDIADLAGVRIALYFPGDRDEMGRVINRLFKASPPKHFPTGGEPSYEKRFSGYWATHYRVHLREDQLSETAKRYAGARIEIQVASVLMHAWAEVEHDLVYKPLTGALSKQEYSILDELNGLVLSGEIALERLQESARGRVAGLGKRAFANHYDLASFIYTSASARTPASKEPIIGRADLLLGFLRRAKMDNPESLRPWIDKLEPTDEDRSLVDQLIDSLLSTDFSLYGAYLAAKTESSESGPYTTNENNKPHNNTPNYANLLGFAWATIEAAVRHLALKQTGQEIVKAIQAIGNGQGSLLKSDDLRSIDGLTDADVQTFEYLKNLTNKIIHEKLFNTAEPRHLERLVRASHGLLKTLSLKSSETSNEGLAGLLKSLEERIRNEGLMEQST